MKQTVEEAADEYMKILPVRAAIKCGDIEDLESHIKVAFKSGAEWMEEQTKTSEKRRMCLIDKNKTCNLCHECDIMIMNPSY